MHCIAAEHASSCPLWVKSGHSASLCRCPLYPQKQTLKLSRVMSALCQKRAYGIAANSAKIPPLARRKQAAWKRGHDPTNNARDERDQCVAASAPGNFDANLAIRE